MTTRPTADEIRNEPAGRRLDVWVATLVMGQTRSGECPLGAPDCPGKYTPQASRWPCLPPYSTDIAAAWEVVLHLWRLNHESRKTTSCSWTPHNELVYKAHSSIFSEPEKAPLIICREALIAVVRKWKDYPFSECTESAT